MAEFWTQGKLEPKRQYRWQVNLGGFGQEIAYVAKKVNKPEITVEEASHKYLNHTYYYPGRTTWNTVTMTLVDPLDVNSSERLGRLLYESGYQVPKDPNDVTTISKAGSNVLMGAVTIMQFKAGEGGGANNTDDIVETWTLNNPFIKKVNFGSLDYSNEDLVDVELEIRYDFATYEDKINGTAPLWKLSD